MQAENMNHKADNLILLHDEPMSRHTSWRAGGAARDYIRAADVMALADYLSTLPEAVPLLWLGLGSNTLVRDGGFAGTVIATQGLHGEDVDTLRRLDGNRVYCGAAVPGAKLARFCSREGLRGAEFFAGIPGLFGGALAMNAGAFGGETWPLVTSVRSMDRRGVIHQREASDYAYGYRQVSGPANEWFLGASLQLQAADTDDAVDGAVDIKALLARRSASQPIGVASCGSVFRNPEGDHAARLIESCGLKGLRIGGAVVSQKHANFIINDAGASAADIESLIEQVQAEVERQTGVRLEPEVRIVGEHAAGAGAAGEGK